MSPEGCVTYVSGRSKRPRQGAFFDFEVFWMKMRTPVRQNALAFWTPEAPRRGEDRLKAI